MSHLLDEMINQSAECTFDLTKGLYVVFIPKYYYKRYGEIEGFKRAAAKDKVKKMTYADYLKQLLPESNLIEPI